MTEHSSYKRSLKSTSLFGGGALISMAINMTRTKFVAILLGPTGVGLIGVYDSLINMIAMLTGLGILQSGIREISKANSSCEPERLARTVITLRRAQWVKGAIGMLAMIIGSAFLSNVSFGNKDHAVPIAVLGLSVLFMAISGGHNCILVGTRRIGAAARISVLSAFSGAIISIPLYYTLGINGIVPSILFYGMMTLLITWLHARRIPLAAIKMSWGESWPIAMSLLRLGVALMLSGLVGTLTAYVIRLHLVHQVGLDGVGIWQAAFSISGLLVGFVFSAMGADYYPRLSAISHDNEQMKRAVNEQTEIALLLAIPGLALTLILAPTAILVFYSGKFNAAIDILRWSVFGIFGRVVSWPLGFVPLAKGMGKTFVGIEIFSNCLYVIAIWICVRVWGLQGTGIAFILLYVANSILNYSVSKRVAAVSWSLTNKVIILLGFSLLVATGLISSFIQNPWLKMPLNLALFSFLTVLCICRLSTKSGIDLGWFKQRLKSRYGKAIT